MNEAKFKVFNARVDKETIRRALIRMGYPMAVTINEEMDLDARPIKEMLPRATQLGHAGTGLGHDKFLRQITIDFDVLAPRYWWTEFDTYGVFTVKNSQSTMHRTKSLDYEKIANKHVDPRILAIFKEIVEEYVKEPEQTNFMKVKANLPEGICLVAGITTNYAQLKTMYAQRRNHRLPEWKLFCNWIESLPYAHELGIC